MSLSSCLKSSLFTAYAFSVPCSLIAFFGLAYVIGMPVLHRDSVVLQLYFLILSVVAFLLLGLLLWLPGAMLVRRETKGGMTRPAAVTYTYLFAVPVMIVILLSVWILRSRPFDLGSLWLLPALVLFSAAGVGLGYLLRDTATGIRRWFRDAARGARLRIILFVFFIPLLVTAAVHVVSGMRGGTTGAETPGASAIRERTDTRLVVIGLDGATFDIMDRLLAEGKLPNIGYLIDHGSRGDLQSHVSKLKAFRNSASMGMRSPALWETVATGKDERKHGIFDFAVMRMPFLAADIPFRLPVVEDVFTTIPTTSTVGKSRRVWEMLSNSGIDVGVVGWWNLWPVAPVENGYVVSSRVQWGMSGSVHPPGLLEGAPENFAFTGEKPVTLFVNRWEGLEWEEFLSIVNSSDAIQNFDSFRRHFDRDNYMAGLSTYLQRRQTVPFYATYFWGPDFVCHLFWKYMEPSLFDDIREEDARLFGEIIDRYYMYLDEVVGAHIERDSLDVTYMILSDHGFGAWQEEGVSSLEPSGRFLHPAYSGKHRENGIIIMSGKHVRQDQDLSDATLFDITPTILTLFGLPVALDMDGRVLVEAIEEDFLERFPVRYVGTYESGEKIVPVAVSSEADDEIKDRLRALGYIN